MATEMFDSCFRRADLDGDGRIISAEAVGFFQGANLPKNVLDQQVGGSQGMPGTVDMAPPPPCPPSSNVSADWLHGRTGNQMMGVNSQVSNSVTSPPASQNGLGVTESALTSSVQPRQPATGQIPYSAQTSKDSSQSADKDTKALVVSGNEPSSASLFGDVFSTNQSQPSQDGLAITSTAGSVAVSPAIVSASTGPQPIGVQGQARGNQSQQFLPHNATASASSGFPAGAGNSASSQSEPLWPKRTQSSVQKYTIEYDSLLTKFQEATIADKHEDESLAKKHEQKCMQVGDVASKLTSEDATFRDIQEKNMELYQEIVKLEIGTEDDRQARAEKIHEDEFSHDESKSDSTKSPDSGASRAAGEKLSPKFQEYQTRESIGPGGSPHAKDTHNGSPHYDGHSDHGGLEPVHSGEKRFEEAGWGRFDNHYDVDSVWGNESFSGTEVNFSRFDSYNKQDNRASQQSPHNFLSRFDSSRDFDTGHGSSSSSGSSSGASSESSDASSESSDASSESSDASSESSDASSESSDASENFGLGFYVRTQNGRSPTEGLGFISRRRGEIMRRRSGEPINFDSQPYILSPEKDDLKPGLNLRLVRSEDAN